MINVLIPLFNYFRKITIRFLLMKQAVFENHKNALISSKAAFISFKYSFIMLSMILI